MKVKVHLWVLRNGDKYEHTITAAEHNCISMIGTLGQYGYIYDGPANQLQAWAAKREIPYQHLVLNVPVELEI